MDNEKNRVTGTKLSVVVTAHDQGAELQRNLPLLLAQQYDAGFEVIVVDESSTDDTEDVLKQLKAENRHLYTTYIPASSHYVSRRKLSITIGVKAAHNEWIILTDASCHPDTDRWLETMANYCTTSADVVCGYTGYDADANDYYTFYRLAGYYRQGERPYCYDGANLAIRKSTFMSRNGFLKNLHFLRGEYHFLVNETDPDRIATMNDTEGFVHQEAPSQRTWLATQLNYFDIRRQLARSLWPKFCFVMGQLLLHLSYWVLLAAIAWCLVAMHAPLFAGLATVALLCYAMLRTYLTYRKVKAYEEHIGWWKLPFYDLRIAWTYLYLYLKYKLADKNDFTRK